MTLPAGLGVAGFLDRKRVPGVACGTTPLATVRVDTPDAIVGPHSEIICGLPCHVRTVTGPTSPQRGSVDDLLALNNDEPTLYLALQEGKLLGAEEILIVPASFST